VHKAAHLSKEPTIRFFAIGAALILVQRLLVGDPRTIVITPVLKADLGRRFQDQLGRPPSGVELDAYLRQWKRDEAVYREALREGIDRDDPTVRNVLIGKMRERAALGTRIPDPTESDLQQYLEQHRNLFEAPLIYEHEYVVFPKSEAGSEQKRDAYARKLKAGATTASLGLRSVGAHVNRERIEQEFGPQIADRICHLPVGQWESLETPDRLLLVKMIQVEGGLPKPDVLRERLAADWKASMEQKALERATDAIANRYQFEEPSK
jgi:hypothetical protein